MTLKDKFEAVKAKIKQNAPAIIATASTGVVVGFAVARYLNHLDELTLKAEHAKEMLRRCSADVTETHVHTNLDAEAKLANGLKARFTHPDMDFDLILQKADKLTKD